MKTVTIFITNVAESRGFRDSELAYANNEVYKDQARIEIKLGGQPKNLGVEESRAILGSPYPNLLTGSQNNPSPEVRELFARTQTPGEINVYYVKDFVFPPTDIMQNQAFSYIPYNGLDFVGSMMSNRSDESTLAHELGHILWNKGNKAHEEVKYDNIMAINRARNANKLTAKQVCEMRNSQFVRPQEFHDCTDVKPE